MAPSNPAQLAAQYGGRRKVPGQKSPKRKSSVSPYRRMFQRADPAESLLESRRCGGIVTWCDRYGARRLGPGGWRLAAGLARGLRQRRRRAERSPASCEEMMIREVKEANLVGSTISTYPLAERAPEWEPHDQPHVSTAAGVFASGIFAPQPQKRGSCKGTH